MRIRLIFIFCICTAEILFAQKKAITENGEEVILYNDGTWKYENEEGKTVEITFNPTSFSKGKKATFLLKSTKNNLGFWLDPSKWSFKKALNNEHAEYELQYKEGDLYAMIISERVEIPLENLRGIAIENGKSVAPDLKIVKEEYRTVNGLKVLLLQMNGTLQGVKFSYYGYYYSNSEGTVQFITYTSQNLLEKHKSTCEELLNGIVEINN
jgi:hypothetical protein